MKRRRVLRVEFIGNRLCCYVSGNAARPILTRMNGGKPPVYTNTRKAYSVSEKTARDAIAIAESRKWTVVIEETEQGELW